MTSPSVTRADVQREAQDLHVRLVQLDVRIPGLREDRKNLSRQIVHDKIDPTEVTHPVVVKRTELTQEIQRAEREALDLFIRLERLSHDVRELVMQDNDLEAYEGVLQLRDEGRSLISTLGPDFVFTLAEQIRDLRDRLHR